MNHENVYNQIINNHKIMDTLRSTNTNKIWNDLIEGLNESINKIAPISVIQCKKEYVPYIGEEVMEDIKESNIQLTKAIDTTNPDKW